MSEIINFINQNQETLAISLSVILIVFLFWNVYLQYSLSKIKKRSRTFFAGKEAKDLEDLIFGQDKRIKQTEKDIEELANDNETIKKILAKCIQKVGVVRFNPFNDVGGNQSFAIALLDNFSSGVIILSLYSRNGVRIYSRSIEKGKAEHKLSKEEEEAINLANKK